MKNNINATSKKLKKMVSIVMILSMVFTLTFSQASFAISGNVPTVSVDERTALLGESVRVDISIDMIPANLISFNLILNFDPNILAVSKIENGDIFPTITPNFHNTTGKVLVGAAATNPVTAGTKLFSIIFTIKEDANIGLTEIILDPQELLLYNTDFAEMPVNISNGSITVTISPEIVVGFINNANTAADVQTILETYTTELGIDLSGYNNLSATDKVLVSQIVLDEKGTEYADVAEVVAAFNTAVDTLKLVSLAEEASLQLDDQELVDTARAKYNTANSSVSALKDGAGKTALETRLSEVLSKIEAAQKVIDDAKAYVDLKAEVEEKVSAYEALANGDLSTQAKVDAANAAKAAISLVGLNEADKVAFEGRISAADAKVVAAQQAINDYTALKSAVEEKVSAYEALANGDLSTQAKVDAANEAKAAINLEGLNETDKAAFEGRIASADAKVTAAQQAIDDYIALKSEVEEKVSAYETLASGDLSTQAKVAAANEAKAAINLEGLNETDKSVFETRIAVADTKVTVAQDRLNAIEAAISAAMEAIDNLPSVEELTLEDKGEVVAARALVDDAIVKGATIERITNIDKLKLLEDRIFELESFVLLSGTVTLIDGVLEGEVDATFIVNGTSTPVKISFDKDTKTATFSQVRITTTIAVGDTIIIKVPGYMSTTFTFGEVIEHEGTNTTPIEIEGIPGDLNGDNEINVLDVIVFANSFNSKIGDENYNPTADLNKDGKIDVRDLFFIGKYFGEDTN